MNRRFSGLTATLLLFCLALSACGGAGSEASNSPTPPAVTMTPAPSPTPSPIPTPTPIPTSVAVSSEETLVQAIGRAIDGLWPTLELDCHDFDLGASPEMTLQNGYYAALADAPGRRHAYDFAAKYDPQGQLARCTLSYMPYKTGSAPAFEGQAVVNSLQDLIAAGRAGLGQERVGISIQNPDLDAEIMAQALDQVGESYVLCTLSRDATELLYSPANGRTMEECLGYLTELDALADAVVAEQITPGMTASEQVTALYDYLTDSVRYDQRYYSDKTTMPYESMTAYGALKDGLAICGGYAHALRLLCDKVGVPCYTVSGTAGGEHHMWNLVGGEDGWRCYDATYDRGRKDSGYRFAAVEPDSLAEGRTWNTALADALMG